MALRTIITSEDEILHKKSKEVTDFNERLHTLLDDMHETLTESGGVGLAAPQVGILRRVVIMDYDDNYFELINPEIILRSGKQKVVEGCLSCPGETCVLERPKKVKVRAADRDGNEYVYTFSDFYAKLACHEIDHLDGILITDIKERYYDPETDKNLK